MRTLPVLIVALLLQIALCAGMSNAAEETAQKSQDQTVGPKEETVPPPQYLDVAFDRNIDRIPVPFLGHDIRRAYKALKERTKSEQKDESETAKKYQQRLAKLRKKPLFGSVGNRSVLAFVGSPKLKYDADDHILIISLITTRLRSDKNRLAVDIKTEVAKEEATGQHASGSAVKIEEAYYKSFELAIHNASRFKTEQSPDDTEKALFVQRIKMGIEDARRSKRRIAALILARPTAPFTSSEAGSIPTTFDDESRYRYEHLYVDVDLIEIWIYNKLTGEIMAKIRAL